MSLRTKTIERFIDNNIAIIPLKGKRPFVEDWYNKDFNKNDTWRKYTWHGVGLKCGKASGIIALDFDTLHEDIKAKIKAICPPIFCGKIGNPNKLPTIFFKYNGEESQDLRGIEVQLLSTGKQTAIPPSPHPESKGKFKWVGRELVKIDIDNLPDLDKSVWDALIDLNEEYGSNKVLRLDLSKSSSGGRNNALKSQVVAGLTKGVDLNKLIQEIIDYDEKHHDSPLFKDYKESGIIKGKSVYENAMAFVCRIVSSLHKSKDVIIPQPDLEDIVISPSIKVGENTLKSQQCSRQALEKHYLKLPHLVGIGNDIFHELYDEAPIPRSQFAFMNAISLISLLIGNRALYMGTGLNFYLYGVAPSGYGKDFPFKRVQSILHEAELSHLIGPSSPTSESTVLKFLEEQQVLCSYINEADRILKNMGSVKSNFGLLEVLTDVFDGPGKHFAPKGVMGRDGELKKFGKIFSPHLSLVLASTNTAFQSFANKNMFDTGLLSRFDIFFEDNYKKEILKDDYNPPLSTTLIARIKRIMNFSKPLINDTSVKFNIPNMKVSDQALKLRREMFQLEIDNKKEDHPFAGVIQRKLLKANKFAGLHHFMKHEFDFLVTEVQPDSIEWGLNCANTIINNMMLSLDDNVSSSEYDSIGNAIIRYIKGRQKKDKPTTRMQISSRFREVNKNTRKLVIEDLIESNRINRTVEGHFFAN